MRKVGSEVAAGVAIFAAFILFIAGFLFLKNTALKAGKYKVHIQFTDVTGLERGDPVSVSGLRVGRVTAFSLEGDQVIVEVELEPEATLSRDSRAVIKSLGMVGEKFIDIVPGSAVARLEGGDIIAGEVSGDLEAITGKAEVLIEEAQALLTQVRQAFSTVLDRSAQASLNQTIKDFGSVAATLDQNSAHMERTFANLDELSTNMNDMLATRRSKLEGSVDNLHTASNRLDSIAGNLDSSLISLKAILSKMENGDGTAGKLLSDDEMYNNMRDLTAELDALVADMKKRPQRYINLGFIKIF